MKKRIFGVLAIVWAVQLPAQAEETSAAVAAPQASRASAPTDVKPTSPWDSFSLTYFATIHGAPLNDLGSSYTVDAKGNKSKTNGISLDGELAASYLITPTIGVGPVIPFVLVPVRGEGIILGDLGARVFDRKLINTGPFWLSANLIFQLPTSKSSQARDMDFAIKTTPAARYRFGTSRWSVGAWTEAKTYLGVSRDKTLKLWGMPYVDFKLTPSVSLNLGYELEAHHEVGMQGADLKMYQSDLQPGVVWFITPHVMINPYVQIFTTTSDIGADHMALGGVFSAAVL